MDDLDTAVPHVDASKEGEAEVTYGCKNITPPATGAPLQVQDGWINLPGQTRAPRMVTVPFVMSTDCRYTLMHQADRLCTGCMHQVGKTV